MKRRSTLATLLSLGSLLSIPSIPNASARADELAKTVAPKACESDWVERVYREKKASVVRIETGGGVGAGFFFGATKQHVVTAFHVVDHGSEYKIVLSDGRALAGRVIAASEDYDLAILELEAKVEDSEPIALSTQTIVVGMPVLAIGHPFATMESGNLAGVFSWSVSTGIVSGMNDRYVQIDAAINPGNSGGPVLDCEGRVVGVVSMGIGNGVNFNVAARFLPLLEARANVDPISFASHFSLQGGIGLAAEHDPSNGRTWYGLELSDSLVYHDRFATSLRVAGYLFDGDAHGAILSETGHRYEVELTERYQLMLHRRSHLMLTFGVGAVLRHWRIHTTSGAVVADDPTCVFACKSHFEVTNDTLKLTRLPLVFRLGVSLRGAELSYAFLLKTSHDDVDSHRLAITFAF